MKEDKKHTFDIPDDAKITNKVVMLSYSDAIFYAKEILGGEKGAELAHFIEEIFCENVKLKQQRELIKKGDRVLVNFHQSQYTLCHAVVKHVPAATGDSWIFEEENGTVHCVSEGCTVTKSQKEKEILPPNEQK